MKKYTQFTTDNVRDEFSKIIKHYIGPCGMLSYKQAAREISVDERTLASWVRGEKQLTLSSLLKLSIYLPPTFIREVINISQKL